MEKRNGPQKEIYEYAFSAVPAGKRKPAARLAQILAAFAFSASGLSIGGHLGEAMPFWRAAGACILGNGLVFLMALFWGIRGCQSGYASAYLIKKLLGRKTAGVFSVLAVMALIAWGGVNGELLADVALAVFPGWPLPSPVTVFLAVLLFVCCSVGGWQSMEKISRRVLPVLLLLTVYGLARMFRSGEPGFLFQAVSEEPVRFAAAVTMVAGNFSLSAVTMPDICRFAKGKRTAAACVLAYALSLFFCNLCGIVLARAAGTGNLNYGIFLLHLPVSMFLWLVLSLYTTQNVNMYTCSLMAQNLMWRTAMGGNISHRVAVWFVGGLSAIAGISGLSRYLNEFTEGIVLITVPLTGIAMVEAFLEKQSERRSEWLPLLAWAVGILLGWRLEPWLGIGRLGLSMVAAAGAYGILRYCSRRSAHLLR